MTEGVQRGSSLVSNYSLPAHAKKAGYFRICMTMEKTERFDFGDKPQAHPDVSFPETETTVRKRTVWRTLSNQPYRRVAPGRYRYVAPTELRPILGGEDFFSGVGTPSYRCCAPAGLKIDSWGCVVFSGFGTPSYRYVAPTELRPILGGEDFFSGVGPPSYRCCAPAGLKIDI